MQLSSTRRNLLSLGSGIVIGSSYLNEKNMISDNREPTNSQLGDEDPYNKSLFTNNKKIGYAKGTHESPVTKETINRIRKTVASKRTEPESTVATISNKLKGEHVIGYATSIQDDYLKTISRGIPESQLPRMTTSRDVEVKSHKQIDNFVKKEGEND